MSITAQYFMFLARQKDFFGFGAPMLDALDALPCFCLPQGTAHDCAVP